jgi:hypothetical protein
MLYILYTLGYIYLCLRGYERLGSLLVEFGLYFDRHIYITL